MTTNIKQLKIKLNKIVKNVKDKGFFHIILSSTLVKIIGMMSAMFLPRIIANKVDYGLLIYVDNIRNYIMLFNALGIASTTIKYCSYEGDDAKRKGYFLVSLLIGIIIDIIIIFGSILYFYMGNFEFEGAKELMLWMSLIPLFTFVFEDIQLFFRACLENKRFSYLSFLYAFISLVCQVGLGYVFSLNGVVLGRYISLIIAILIGIYFYKSLPYKRIKAKFPDFNNIKKMLRFSLVLLAANITSSVMQLNEVTIIGKLLHDEAAIADYKVASYILSISLFLVESITLFIYPYFVKHADDKKWVWNKFKKLSLVNAIIMIPLHLVLIALSKFIIIIIFGESYIGATSIMQILLIASLGQSLFRGIIGNILVAIGEEKFNLSINIGFMILHIFIDVIAISIFGLKGAAIALCVVYYLSGLTMIVHLKNTCMKFR